MVGFHCADEGVEREGLKTRIFAAAARLGKCEKEDRIMNLITLDEHSAKIVYDSELDLFRGEILGLSGGVDF
jgi:hypothetical protein